LELGKLVGTHAAISIAEDAEEKSWENERPTQLNKTMAGNDGK
jgi:hypothetical protein